MNEIEKKIIGTWKLVYSVEIDAAGNKYYPFGEDAIGYIIYSESKQMAVQITRVKRKPYFSKNFVSATSEELTILPKDYLAYFGTYEIDLKNEVVQHFLLGSLYPNNVGQVLERKYHFYDDKMSLKPWDGTNREILWQRVSD